MKYLYCTIAVGESYFNSALNFAEKLNHVSNSHHMLIVTDLDGNSIPNTTFYKLPNQETKFINGVFNYMLKHYPIKIANQMDYDYIIFVDADWRVRSEYDNKKIEDMLEYMNQNGYDLFFERPHNIGKGKHDGIECFWNHKIDFYKLKETNIYDKGHVCNEQFLVFKKNEKLKLFVDKFEELYKIGTKAKIWPFAEGLEMGMSMAYADMNFEYISWMRFVRDMFEFNSRDGGLNIRF